MPHQQQIDPAINEIPGIVTAMTDHKQACFLMGTLTCACVRNMLDERKEYRLGGNVTKEWMLE